MTTAWIDAMKLPECDQRLAQLVRIAPVPMPNLDQLAPEDAGKALHLALKGFYSPSAQDLALVREIASVGRSHAQTYYRSDEQFIAWASSKPQFQPSPEVRMLTGPSGVGKSELLKAVKRLFSRTQFTQPSSNLPPFPIYPVNSIQIRTGTTNASIFSALSEGIGLTPDLAKRSLDNVTFLRLRMYQVGVSLIATDEMQFVTGSTAANALAARLLMLMADFGPPVVYACNYSLGHRLMTRPPEDRVRFLSRPMVMLPMAADDPALHAFLSDAAKVMNGALAIDAIRDAQELHAMTFGLRRLLVRLLVVGYSVARHRAGLTHGVGNVKVTMNSLREAYASRDFEVERNIVRSSISAQLGCTDDRNYVCPVEIPAHQQALLQNQVKQHHQFAINQAITLSERTGAERIEADAMARRAGQKLAKTTLGKPTRRGPPPPRTAAELLAALR